MNSPSPEELTKARKNAGLTQSQCAAIIHVNVRTWQKYEGDERKMPPAYWELFLIKTNLLDKQ